MGDDEVDVPEDTGTAVRCREDEELYTQAELTLKALRQQLPQYSLDGFQNIWLLKPGGKSRGRGIQLSARLEKILEVGVGRGAEARWIVQKYIEDPLIINKKKFDIRQWVVLTQLNPLAVWFYQDSYLRFSFHDYNTEKLKNRYAHLTNNSVSKHARDFDDQVDETMWSSDDFQKYLSEHIQGEDPWRDVVQPQMKKIVSLSMECVQDAIMPRSSTFQLFGYDFMVTADLRVWLIEVNSSPDCSYSTSTTRVLVKSMLEDLVHVVVDVEQFGARERRPKRKWPKHRNAGRYELLNPHRRQREEKFGRVRSEAKQLVACGNAVHMNRLRKGDCPCASDRFDAISLLEAQSHAAQTNSQVATEGVDIPARPASSDGEEGDDDSSGTASH